MISQADLNLLSALRADLTTIREQIASMKVGGDQQVSVSGQYPEKPIPSRLGGEIVFDGTMNKHQINIKVASDGCYFANAIAFAFRITNYAPYSQTWRSISSIDDFGLTFPELDFYWEYKISGSGRERQNIPVPSAMVRRTETGNGWMPLVPQDVFPAASLVSIIITPTVDMNSQILAPGTPGAGRIWAGFNGYYSLG